MSDVAPPLRHATAPPLVRRRQRLAKIVDQILRRLEPDRQPHDLRPRARGETLLVRQLSMRRRRRMQNEAARVADIDVAAASQRR